MNKKVILVAVIALAIVIFAITMLGKNISYSKLDFQGKLDNKEMKYVINSISYLQLNAVSGREFNFDEGTVIWELEYNKDSEFFKKIERTNMLVIENTDVNFNVTVKGNKVYLVRRSTDKTDSILKMIK